MTVEITTLPSGLRIITDSMRDLETASIGVWVGAGSRDEMESEHGLSHLLEHMAFKGTKRRSAKAIAEEIESVGGDLNAATSTENTAYYARVLADDTGLALDIFADILTDSVFDAQELEREKSVILQEIGAVEDTPDDLVFDLFNAAAYPGQPIGRTILGTPERVSSFDRSAIETYLGRHYAAPVSIIAAAGAVDHQRIVNEAGERFGALAPQQKSRPSPALYIGGESIQKRRLEQTHVVVGFEGRSFHDEEEFALHVFAYAVGEGMSSRLFQEVREERGLAYSIYSFHWPFLDTGVFGFYAATAPSDVRDLMPVALDCMSAATEDLTTAEVDRAKAQMKVSLLTALESSSARAEQIARQHMAYGRVLQRDEMIGRIDGLTLEQVRRAGARSLRSAPTVAAIGDVSKVMTQAKVAARLA
ncbi:MAG: insulinase family protein [Beijerinckiaceae bacterium]|jgi:predicted Zn-dependent peptidase|nr:insulinase family protein [Beijerinckiaceae bacterium]